MLKGMAANNPIVRTIGGLDQFVAGNTWWEAMNALRLNPEYATKCWRQHAPTRAERSSRS